MSPPRRLPRRLPGRPSRGRPTTRPCPRPSRTSAGSLAPATSPQEAPLKAAFKPWVITRAADSARAEALAGATEQREADHAAMSEAVSDFCRVLGSGDVPSGSSPQSRLQALGDHARGRLREALHHSVKRAFAVLPSHYVVDLHVRGRLGRLSDPWLRRRPFRKLPSKPPSSLKDHARGRVREALHHGVRRAFAVLASHYVVDLERVSEGYCLPDEDEVALAEVQRLDAVAAGPSAALATTFEAEILPPAPSPEAEMDLTEGGDGAEGATPSQGDA